MSVATLLSGLQQEVIYGTSWLSTQSVDTCGGFQTLYESESCCSGNVMAKEFVVVERPSSACEVGWRSVTLGGVERCLKLHGTAVWTKDEAVAACASEGAELVMPKTATDDATVLGIINALDGSATSWLYFWINAQQDAAATAQEEAWTWGDNTDVTNFGWANGQPTSFPNAPDDGPEDCALYRKSPMSFLTGWYDFECSPSAHVVCMVPYVAFLGGCWGVDASDATWVGDSGLQVGGQDVCLKVMDDTSYNIDLARNACGNVNGQLYYPQTAAESNAFGVYVHGVLGNAKVWINVEQDSAATQPGEDWKLPTGATFPSGEIPWAVSDPEPTEPTTHPGQDFVQLHASASGSAWQDVTRMTTGSGALCVKDKA